MIAIYGLDPAGPTPTEEQHRPDESDENNIFAQHYTPATQAALPAMHLRGHEPLLVAARAAGFDHADYRDWLAETLIATLLTDR